MIFSLPSVYPITDRPLSSLSHCEQVAALSEGGASLIQLRDKSSASGEFYRDALDALALGRRLGVRIIINDRVDIALALGADGVHLGQDDMPPEAARKLLGEEAIIGFSTHNQEQALAAAEKPVDYIGLGPIFPTSSKEKSDRLVGLEGLRRVRQSVEMPIVAIGGITLANAREVLQAGADSVAIISAILADKSLITSRVRALLSIHQSSG